MFIIITQILFTEGSKVQIRVYIVSPSPEESGFR